MTLFDHIRIVLGTFCLALAAHPAIGTVTTVRDRVDCQIVALAEPNVINADATFHCGGAEIPLADPGVHVDPLAQVSHSRTRPFVTRWLRCQLTERATPLAFGLLSDVVTRSIAACRPLMVAPTPKRWLCFNTDRHSCLG